MTIGPFKRNARFAIIFLFLPLILYGCASESADDRKNTLKVSVREPVEKDWKAIQETGVLRMITRYSSNTYFLHQGLEYGFEYELLKRFAENHGLALEVVVMKPNDNPYDMLNSGKGDIIAANYAVTEIREQIVDFTRPYNIVSQILVFSGELYKIPQTLEEVDRRNIPITVRPNSSYYHRLLELQRQGYSFNINLVSNTNHTEALLIDVSRGEYVATVADNNIFRAVNSYMDHLAKGPVLDKQDKIAWAVRKNADGLKKELNQFLAQQFRIDENEVKRSAFLNILRDRYFDTGRRLNQYYTKEFANLVGVISPFDELFKQVADSAGVDWLLLAAVAAQESHFNPYATGRFGAIGLMQVMPRYATADSAALYDPKVNIRQGARMLKNHLQRYAYIPEAERMQFALAAYNAGQGHLNDARRLAMDFDNNPNNWEYVAGAFLKLMDRTYYKNARYGFCRGIITVEYVREVMNRYSTYKTVLALAAAVD